MSEINLVYQEQFLGANKAWVDITPSRFKCLSLQKKPNYEFRILYPAASYKELQKENAELKEDLQFVERWVNHHSAKPNVTAQEALSCIQHYPSIAAITKSYKDGIIPNTRNPYAEIEAQAKRIAELEAAVKANHEWHQENDDYDGYQESELCITNTAALAASKNGE